MSRYKKLTLLHSNDLHGDFSEEQLNEKLVGGVSMLSGYVDKVRKEEKNTLYCIAGDMFRGSVIDSEFKGMSTIEIMNAIAPDVVTLGNHETDYGIAHLLFLEKCARFPIINANLYIKSNYARLFTPQIVLEVDGMKILFIGILTEEVMSQTKNEAIIGSFVDIHEAALEIGKICNAYNASDIDLTVLLTHIGFEEDKLLAAQLDPSWGVDLIIGGHSHTFIDEPAVVNDIVIVQAGTGTDQIGRFDLTIDTYNNDIEDFTWKTIPIVESNCPRDTDIERILNSYKQETDKKYGRTITRLRRTLTHPKREMETELGGLLSDIVKDSLALDLMLFASGNVRTKQMGPLVTYQDLVECIAFDDSVHMMYITGAQLKRMLKFMLRDEVWQGAHNEFYQLSKGMKVVYDRKSHEMLEFSYENEPILDDRLFKVGLQNYHFLNFTDFFNVPIEEVEANKKSVVMTTSTRDVIEEYLISHQHLDREIDGRLTLI
ncbi:MAG: 5'-nucleotidase C-terminal domain-containing protein [Erysipelotrichaceae bacterium]|nr:5'-nucleotidase C-terminal domain-containing protein [Erysipelotrichaceae bacterium]